MKVLTNKNGVSYILTCVVVIIAVMVMSVFLQYAYVYHTAVEQKNETQLKLDGYITKCAIQYHDAIKQGESWEGFIDRKAIVNKAYPLLGFQNAGITEYKEQTEYTEYTVFRPAIQALEGDMFGIAVKYTIKIPFVVFDKKIADITVPIEIISRFTQK